MNTLYLVNISIIFLLLSGCTGDNPKTNNERLRNKKISWSEGLAESFEFLADSTFIAVGGDFPQEGYKGGRWESVSEDGSFKIITNLSALENFHIARLKTPMTKGSTFIFESFPLENKTIFSGIVHTVTSYENLGISHNETAIQSEARAYITRYAHDVHVLTIMVEDQDGGIKKVLLEGEMITTEVMMTNGKKWNNNPAIILPQEWQSNQSIRTNLTIQNYKGGVEKATFLSSGYKDNSSQVFEDSWF